MTQHKRALISKVVRLLNAVDVRHAAMEEAADADAGFDAGEFSGPAHWRWFRRDADALARRYGFADYALANGIAAMLNVATGEPAHVHLGEAMPLP